MITIEVKFENEADKESFITSVVNSFNSSGKEKSVHANTVERSGDTLFFTRKMVEEGSYAADPVAEPTSDVPVTAPDVPVTAPEVPSVPRGLKTERR